MSAAVEANRVYLAGHLAVALGAALLVVDEALWVRALSLIVLFAGMFVMGRGRRALNRTGVLKARPGERSAAIDWFGAAAVSAMAVLAFGVLIRGGYGYAPAALVFALNLGSMIGWTVLFGPRIAGAEPAA